MSAPLWSRTEDAIIREHYAREGKLGVAERLAVAGCIRTPNAVCCRASILRLAEASAAGIDPSARQPWRRDAWSAEEDAIIQGHYQAGGPDACMRHLQAAGYHRSPTALTSRAQAIGCRVPRRPRTRPHDDSKLLTACNPKPCDPRLELRLTALVMVIGTAMRLRPGLGAAECVARVTRAANEDPGALDMVADRIAWARAGRRRATA